MTRRAKRRAPMAFRSFAVLFGAAVLVAIGCAGNIIPPPAQCMGAGCSCDEDPLQPLCKAFNDRPDGQIDMTDAGRVDANDGSVQPDTSMTPDAEADGAASDAADEGG